MTLIHLEVAVRCDHDGCGAAEYGPTPDRAYADAEAAGWLTRTAIAGDLCPEHRS